MAEKLVLTLLGLVMKLGSPTAPLVLCDPDFAKAAPVVSKEKRFSATIAHERGVENSGFAEMRWGGPAPQLGIQS